jgi:hypothetical protein
MQLPAQAKSLSLGNFIRQNNHQIIITVFGGLTTRPRTEQQYTAIRQQRMHCAFYGFVYSCFATHMCKCRKIFELKAGSLTIVKLRIFVWFLLVVFGFDFVKYYGLYYEIASLLLVASGAISGFWFCDACGLYGRIAIFFWFFPIFSGAISGFGFCKMIQGILRNCGFASGLFLCIFRR